MGDDSSEKEKEMQKLYDAIGYTENEVITPFPKEVLLLNRINNSCLVLINHNLPISIFSTSYVLLKSDVDITLSFSFLSSFP